jgi:hypothetical protein
MEWVKSLAGELKLVAMLVFVVGTVWVYAWSAHIQAKADQCVSFSAPDPDLLPRLLHARLDDDY